jgi:hypothetical protein
LRTLRCAGNAVLRIVSLSHACLVEHGKRDRDGNGPRVGAGISV